MLSVPGLGAIRLARRAISRSLGTVSGNAMIAGWRRGWERQGRHSDGAHDQFAHKQSAEGNSGCEASEAFRRLRPTADM